MGARVLEDTPRTLFTESTNQDLKRFTEIKVTIRELLYICARSFVHRLWDFCGTSNSGNDSASNSFASSWDPFSLSGLSFHP